MMSALPGLVAFVAALIIGTFVEYWGHRLMHQGKLLRRRHAGHHQRGTGKGFLAEFFDYSAPTLLVIWVGFLHSWEAGVGFVVGDLTYAFMAAYAHQLQHEHPQMVFWLPRPVHAMHHYHSEWHHNFGILVDWWDHLFGTYKPHEEPPEWIELDRSRNKLWNIHWASSSPKLPSKPKKSNSTS